MGNLIPSCSATICDPLQDSDIFRLTPTPSPEACCSHCMLPARLVSSARCFLGWCRANVWGPLWCFLGSKWGDDAWCRSRPTGSCVVAAIDNYTQATESCGGIGMAQPHSQEESTLTLAWTGFCCFSGHITLRMILIYYVQVQFRRLPKTKERVLLIT